MLITLVNAPTLIALNMNGFEQFSARTMKQRRPNHQTVDPSTGLRKCNKCGGAFPLSSFFKRWRKSRNALEYDSGCKSCELKRLIPLRRRYGGKYRQLGPKTDARHALEHAVESRRVAKPTACSVCGRKPERIRELHGHHEDYTKPLEVIWVCVQCHRLLHAMKECQQAA